LFGIFSFNNNLRSSKLFDGADVLVRNSGKNMRGMSTAKQANTIAKTTVGRVKIDIGRL
jgi:hypothetical protein